MTREPMFKKTKMPTPQKPKPITGAGVEITKGAAPENDPDNYDVPPNTDDPAVTQPIEASEPSNDAPEAQGGPDVPKDGSPFDAGDDRTSQPPVPASELLPEKAIVPTEFPDQSEDDGAQGRDDVSDAPSGNGGPPVPKATQDSSPAEPATDPVSSEDDDELPEIEPALSGASPELSFPFDFLHSDLSSWVRDTALSRGTSNAAVVMALLAAMGSIIGNSRVGITSSGWKVPPVLWVILSGGPASGKSPALSAVLDLVEWLEAEQRGGEMGSGAGRAPSAARRKELRLAQEMGLDLFDGGSDEGGAASTVKLFCGLATVPGFESFLQQNLRGAFVVEDELSELFNARYESSRKMMLKAFDGRGHRRMVNRKEVVVPLALIGMMGGVQPDVLEKQLNGKVDDGFLARFLLVLCGEAAPAQLSMNVDNGPVMQVFRRLYDLDLQVSDRGPEPKGVPFSAKAMGVLEHVRQKSREMQKNQPKLIASFIGKASGTIGRLAVIKTFADAAARGDEEPTTIGSEAVLASVELFQNFLLPMARAAFEPASLSSLMRQARDVVSALKVMNKSYVSRHEILRAGGHGLGSSDKLRPVLLILEHKGILRYVGAKPSGPKGGHPSEGYEVNPLLLTQIEAETHTLMPPKAD